MILVIHRRDHVLWHGDYPVRWSSYQWEPSPYRCVEHPSGNRTETAASVPIRVKVPIGSRLVDRWLITHHHPKHGFDARTVWHLACAGKRGIRIP